VTGPRLWGRDAERQELARLLATARLGVGATVAVTGEAGVGKSALVDDAIAGAEGMRVLRAVGLDAERHLPFAGLLQLLRPTLDRLEDLAHPQAEALAGALGLSAEPPGTGDRFMIGAAVLGLLARYAEDGPVVVVVDDLQALDLPSVEAVLFAARRLAADPVAVLLAARSPDADHLLVGFPVLRLEGLGHDASAALVAEAAGGPLPPGQVDPLLALAGGNPLALLELAGHDLDALATGSGELPARVPEAVTVAYARRFDRLDEDCRTALLVAAVSGGDLAVTTRACVALGVEVAALAEAEDAGLVAVRLGQVAFRHPLVRSAVYSRAGGRDRRAVHAAVAEALPAEDADRRAWHLAEAVWEPDPQIAGLLAEAGDRARARTAYSVASGAYERAARLHPDGTAGAGLLLLAAETAWSAGLTERAVGLLDAHAREPGAEAGRVRELALRGAIAARTGRLRDAREMLLAAADLSTDPAEQCVLVADAVHASFYLAGAPAAVRMAQRLVRLTPSVEDPTALALGLIAVGLARAMAGEPGGAEPLLAAVPLIQASPELTTDPHRLSCVMLVPLVLRDATGGRTLRELVDEVRRQAGVGALPTVLFHVARDQATTASWEEATANYTESVRLAEETGQVTERLMSLAGLCWLESRQGKEEACRAHAAEVLAAPAHAHLPMAEAWVRFALGDLELSLGHPELAVPELRALEALMARHELADVDLMPGPELVEALLRLGEVDAAVPVAVGYQQAAEAKDQPWSRARAARAMGQLGGERGDADTCFTMALEVHGSTLDRFETARTRLAYGEWLRRAARRVEARTHLRAALEDFEDLGASRWAARAASELEATGETVRRRGASPRSQLTAQELQVSLLLAEGRTTRETAAALFLSPKTVEYHLRKVYTKLGIGSRPELAELLSTP
jgi:DNA-binding CsgD family transcriptional regulator